MQTALLKDPSNIQNEAPCVYAPESAFTARTGNLPGCSCVARGELLCLRQVAAVPFLILNMPTEQKGIHSLIENYLVCVKSN